MFRDFEGRVIRVVTDLMQVTAEQIAQMYKARWQMEVFFRSFLIFYAIISSSISNAL
ncbi:transposase [Paenibacillus sp. NRS-1782]|uniref:transposase n=1 Tax=unclassified Paenibacillus TaxID=185978 RepID=UPI003D2C7A77